MQVTRNLRNHGAPAHQSEGQETGRKMLAGGPALKAAIRSARAMTEYDSDQKLADAAGISRAALDNWYSERNAPDLDSLVRVADRLDQPVTYLLEAYQGRPQATESRDEVVAVLRDHLRAVEAQTRAVTDLVSRLDMLLPSETFPAEEAWAAVARVLTKLEPQSMTEQQARDYVEQPDTIESPDLSPGRLRALE